MKDRDPSLIPFRDLLEIGLEHNRTLLFYHHESYPSHIRYAIFSAEDLYLPPRYRSGNDHAVVTCSHDRLIAHFDNWGEPWMFVHRVDKSFITPERDNKEKKRQTVSMTAGSVKALYTAVRDPEEDDGYHIIHPNVSWVKKALCRPEKGSLFLSGDPATGGDLLEFNNEYDGSFGCNFYFSIEPHILYAVTPEGLIRVNSYNKTRKMIVSYDGIGALWGYDFDARELRVLTWGSEEKTQVKLTNLISLHTKLVARDIGNVLKI